MLDCGHRSLKTNGTMNVNFVYLLHKIIIVTQCCRIALILGFPDLCDVGKVIEPKDKAAMDFLVWYYYNNIIIGLFCCSFYFGEFAAENLQI